MAAKRQNETIRPHSYGQARCVSMVLPVWEQAPHCVHTIFDCASAMLAPAEPLVPAQAQGGPLRGFALRANERPTEYRTGVHTTHG